MPPQGPSEWNRAMTNDKTTTHFGFQTVDEDQKAGMVHGVFFLGRVQI